MSKIIVMLGQKDIDEAIEFIGVMRDDKVEHSVTDKKFDEKNTSYAVNLMGYLGEIAVARALNVEPDRTVRTGGDDGYDLVYNNKTIQVKTSTLPSLIFNSPDLFTADIAILVQLVGDRQNPHINAQYHILGQIRREDFEKRAYQKDYGYGTRYVVDSEYLMPVFAEVK